MTDSGGFQVFSLGWGRVHGIGKVAKEAGTAMLRARAPGMRTGDVRISEDGVEFYFSGKKYYLSPEQSMRIQRDLGADIIFAFDEPTSPLHSHSYTKAALARTHRWAARCIREFEKLKAKNSKPKANGQALFGIVQGSIFEDLRKRSSKYIGSLPFEGFGIGGSYGEKQMKDAIRWSLAYLPADKPRHLLGIGKIKDIFPAVREGVDFFDCVVPTREGRHGMLYTTEGRIAVERGIFGRDRKAVDRGCPCYGCHRGMKRKDFYRVFKEERLKGQRLATIHNIAFFKRLFSQIRTAIAARTLEKLEKKYYTYMK